MQKKDIYRKVATQLPHEPIPFETIELVARRYKLNPVVLFLIHNDILLSNLYSDEYEFDEFDFEDKELEF